MPSCKNCGKEIGCCVDDTCVDCDNHLQDLKLAYETLVETLDCGDSGCLYKKKNEYGVYGMRTNGGCNCLGMKSLRGGQRRALQKLLHEVKELVGDGPPKPEPFSQPHYELGKLHSQNRRPPAELSDSYLKGYEDGIKLRKFFKPI